MTELNKAGSVTVPPLHDSTIYISLHNNYNPEVFKTLTFHNTVGDVSKPITANKFSLPFPVKRSYKIIQGYNGSFSHNENYSRYALDFDLAQGDTVCSADNGVVVGSIKGYKIGGADKKFRDYANFITIYHPHSGMFTQYVHLKYGGVLVKLGDSVITGQPIALSGKTGWTTVPHLHFNVLVPGENGLASTPAEFIEGYNGRSLTANTRVTK